MGDYLILCYLCLSLFNVLVKSLHEDLGSWTHVNSTLTRKLVWPTLIGVFSVVTDEPFEFEKVLVQIQYLMSNTNHFRRTYRIYPKLINNKNERCQHVVGRT